MKKKIKAILSAILFLVAVVPLLVLDTIVFMFLYAFSKTWLLFPLSALFVLIPCLAYWLGRILLKDWL